VELTDGSRFSRVAIVCDLVALALFVVVGMTSHRLGSAVVIFLRTAVPLILAWLVVAWWFRTYRPPAFTSLFGTWAMAVPVAVAARAALTGQLGAHDFWVFLGVAMAFTLLFLGVGRGIALAIARPWRSP
jgi:hypothetical protein